jgi:hypothetical protein
MQRKFHIKTSASHVFNVLLWSGIVSAVFSLHSHLSRCENLIVDIAIILCDALSKMQCKFYTKNQQLCSSSDVSSLFLSLFLSLLLNIVF